MEYYVIALTNRVNQCFSYFTTYFFSTYANNVKFGLIYAFAMYIFVKIVKLVILRKGVKL